MTPTQRERIKLHGERLQAIFPESRGRDPIALCKALRRIEVRMERFRLDQDIEARAVSLAEEDRIYRRALAAVDKLLEYRAAKVPVFINSDPRGYALKIQDTWMREHGAELETDWGGYGILAPEITP